MSLSHRVGPASLVALLIAGLVAGCTPATPSATQLVGRWEHDHSVSLTLEKDRTCTARLLVVSSLVVSGTCTWRILDGDTSRLLLDFSGDPSARATSAELGFDGSGADLRLTSSVGGEPWDLTRAE
jgi:hypothetical protein